jgi:two-component system chemotaxis sensor kinase CheA
MSLIEDITQEELEVFLQEADEQLLLLDEDLIKLEKEGSKAELLQEIFRAAHTLKGSSAMVGLEKMSRVAHAAETVLDKMRNHTLPVSTEVIDALLQSLDALKSLRQELVSGEDGETDIEGVVAALAKVGSDSPEAAGGEAGAGMPPATVISDKELVAMGEGLNAYRVKVEINKDGGWAAVRCFQVLDELSQMGEILGSVPSKEEVENGTVDQDLEVLLASPKGEGEIRDVLGTVPELLSVQVNLSLAASGEEAAEKAPSEGAAAEEKTPSQKLARAAQTVRVDVKLLDDLMNLVGEMVIERNRIRQTSKVLETRYEGDEAVGVLRETAAHMMKLVSELQESVLQARMLPVGMVFNGFPRLVRDLAQKAGKKVEFVIEGQETELDRTIIEQIRDPLVHLLRNSVDHGIEPPDERRAVGKEEKGSILLSAYQEQSHIIIVVEDDGSGIDAARVIEKAVSSGLITAEEAGRMPEGEAQNLIFAPGLSTAKKVTEVSGRGVGMDVVRNNIESLGGSVHVESRQGEGSRFMIRLPFTLATINGLLVQSLGDTYVIPTASLEEVLRLTPDEVESVMRKDVIRVRGSVLPLLRLDDVYGGEPENNEDATEILVVVVRAGDKTVGLVVDSVMETQDSVVKSLGKYIGNVRGISGATILGDGQVALIMDTATLVRDVTGYGAQQK